MEVSLWEFTCSVCKKSYGTHNDWLFHFLLPSHQRLAKRECKQWNESVKECVVVAFSTVPVMKDTVAVSILSDLSSMAKGTIVTDFILWNDRPRVAFIQFESKNKVAEIIQKESQMAEMELSTCRIHVKRAVDLMGLEWQEFFHDSGADRKQKECTEIDVTTDFEPKRRKTSQSGMLVDCPPLSTIVEVGIPSKKPAQPLKISPPLAKTSEVNIFSKKPEPLKTSLPLPLPKTNEVGAPSDKVFGAISTSPLRSQYFKIKEEMAIPSCDFMKMVNLLETVRSILEVRFSKCKLHLFRHWYLRTRNCGTNQLLIFLDLDDIWDKPWNVDVGVEIKKSYQRTGYKSDAEILQMSSTVLLTKNIKKVNSLEAESKGVDFEVDRCGYNFFDENSGIVFGLFNHASFILETQTSRLVKYLSSFDPRVVPLISLINYWAKLNKVFFAPNLATDLRVKTIVGAEPSSLEWLVVSFLCRQRFIPSVREVLENPHNKLMFQKQDIGFSDDINFSQKWIQDHSSPEVNTDKFIESIFLMAHDFFDFYGYSAQNSKILNTKDAELIEENDLYLEKATRLSSYERKLVKETFKKSDMKHVMEGFKILHPLCVSCFLSFGCNSFAHIFQNMFKETAVKLKRNFKYSTPKPGIDLISLLLCDER